MSHQPWQDADEGEVNKRVLDYVREVERVQIDIFDRFVKLAALYDPNSPGAALTDRRSSTRTELVSENVIATYVDTLHASIASVEVRARFTPDDADWSSQRQCRLLEWYADAAMKKFEVHGKCAAGFKNGAALKGTALNKVWIDEWDRINVECVPPDDIVVDEAESRNGSPRQMHHRMIVDKDVLKGRFPDFEEGIDRAQRQHGEPWREWADYRPLSRDEVVVVESWYLPIGVKGRDGYRSGRHTIVIDGADLFDEEWDETFFPFAVMRWSEKSRGWYGIGLAERIAGHQRVLNKLNWQVDRQLDQLAVPTTYVGMADAAIAVKTVNRAGTIVPTKGGADSIKTVIPPAVSPETYARLERVSEKAGHEAGVSSMAARAAKPAGLDSGIALREHRDQTSTRHAQQEKGFERFVLDTLWLVLWCCKRLGADAPIFVRKSRAGRKEIKWTEVDLDEVRTQMQAASSLSKTPAGRLQLALEWAQAGVISQDEARRLMRVPDTERAISLYTAAIETIEKDLEDIKFNEAVLTPEPFQNMEMIVWRGQAEYNLCLQDGTPEEVLENLRQYIVQSAHIVAEKMKPPAAPAMPGAMPGALPADPMAAAAAPPMPGAPDMGPVMTGAGVAPASFQ